MTYAELNKLSPETFLKSSAFKTSYDGCHETSADHAKRQYAKGLEVGRESLRVIIDENGTWAADGRNGAMTTSYEGIGYHAHTAELLQGFLDSGCEIVVQRRDKGATIIKKRA